LLLQGFEFPGAEASSLLDYAVLSALSYELPNVTKQVNDIWFGPNEVVDEDEFVANYRESAGNSNNPVYFKLFNFSNINGAGVVAIRGSETNWDWFVNIQMWASSGFAQIVEGFVPFGWLFHPILDTLVMVANSMERLKEKKSAYYRVVSGFVNALFDGYGGADFRADGLRVTGASLGGGQAIIVGAQTPAHAVAISGPSAELNHLALLPQVSLEALNTNVLNVVPDRDLIARLGGQGRLVQKIACKAPVNSLFGCHSMWRSVCEIAFACGTEGRAVFCRCIRDFGYPLPIQNGTRSFDQACPPSTS